MSDEQPQNRIDVRVFQIMEAAARQAGMVVPDLEGVAVVALWRFQDQQGIPSVLLVGSQGPLMNPDQLARLSVAGARLQAHLAQAYADSILRLRQVENRLMRLVNEHESRMAQLASPAGAQETATQGPEHGVEADDEGRP